MLIFAKKLIPLPEKKILLHNVSKLRKKDCVQTTLSADQIGSENYADNY